MSGMESTDVSVSIRNLSLNFGTVSVLKNLDLDVQDGEFLVLLGPSGSLQIKRGMAFRAPLCPIYFSNLLLEFDFSMMDADILGKEITFKPPS